VSSHPELAGFRPETSMTSRAFPLAASVVAATVVLASACTGDLATAPGAPDLGRGKPPTQDTHVSLANLVLESTTLTIDGPAVNYTVDIVNTGGKRPLVTLQGTLVMADNGNIVRAAGGTHVFCGGPQGTLPHGTCTMQFTAQASNSTGGQGTLVPGAAGFTLTVLDSEGGRLAIMQVPVTLQ
jgi:hypothetical protein